MAGKLERIPAIGEDEIIGTALGLERFEPGARPLFEHWLDRGIKWRKKAQKIAVHIDEVIQKKVSPADVQPYFPVSVLEPSQTSRARLCCLCRRFGNLDACQAHS